MRNLLKLYNLFFYIGIQTFGGGYSMIPRLKKKFVDELGWISEDEMLDYITIGQCTPGVITINLATFIGYKKAGILGGIVSTLGMISPSFLIILLLSFGLERIVSYQVVMHAFSGVRVGVTALIFSTFLNLYNKCVIDNKTFGIFLTVVVFGIFTSLKPVYLVIYSGILGIILTNEKEMK